MKTLLEKNRRELIDKSKKSDNYVDTSKGKNRWERRLRSKIANSVRDYNRIDMNAFWKEDILEFGINVQGETNNYVVTVLFENILPTLRNEVKRNNEKFEFKCVLQALIKVFNSDDVYVSCTCPDFKYTQDYWATKDKYNSGTPQLSNGKGIRNPNDTKGAGCKHINLVLSNVEWLMKVASVINNYVHYCQLNMEDNYARYIFPKIYGRSYDKVAQLSLLDKDELTSDIETMNLVNALGRLRGRYKPKPEVSINPRYQKQKTRINDKNPLNLKFENDKEESKFKLPNER